jgi:phosphoadenosine phosphosulfate reductase
MKCLVITFAERFRAMNYEEIKSKLNDYKKAEKRYFTTSSFQSHSLVLLHILSRINPHIPVVFINTGFHFPATISFRDKIIDSLGLTNPIDLKSEVPKSLQKGKGGRLLFATDPDYCCYTNKTEPLDNILRSYDIWINGVRADQSDQRKAMDVEQAAPHDSIRFHPMLNWSSKMINEYRKEYDLPSHPLEEKGYMSIGCEPCTRRVHPEMSEREVRWYGLNKTECGLHTDLIEQ